MSRYGAITDSHQTPEEFRVESFLQDMLSINFGNCGVPEKLQDFLIRDKKGIEDIFLGQDCLYILPKSQQSAKYLFDLCVGDKDEYDSYPNSLADEISWVKLGNRYYLSLWWD